MLINDFFNLSVKNNDIADSEFIYSLFTDILQSTKYINVTDNVKMFIVNGKTEPIDDYDGVGPILKTDTEIVISEDSLPIIKGTVKTTPWIVVLNYILLYIPFKGTVKFRTDKLNVKDIEEQTIMQAYRAGQDITEIIKRLSISTSFIRQFADFTVIPATEKTITPPPNIKEVKASILKELTEKYGESPYNTKVGTFDIEARLIDVYKDYMKDDPTYGVITKGKMINIVGKKRFLTVGYEDGFELGDEVNIEESLDDGYPKDKDKLATLFNIARAGSFYRGHETRDAGQTSKEILDAVAGMVINVEDCGVKYGYPLLITKSNHKYITDLRTIKNGITTTITDAEQYIGKTIEIRLPITCKARSKHSDNSICKMCVSEHAARYENSATIMGVDLGGIMLGAKMAKTHGVANTLREYKITDMFS